MKEKKTGLTEPESSVNVEAGVSLQLAEEIITVLSNCKTKLQLYRANMNGEYLGGVEYTELIKRIDDLFSKLSNLKAIDMPELD